MDITVRPKPECGAALKKLWAKYGELIIYILVGGGTTLVAWGCKYLWNLVFFDGTSYPTMLQNSVLSTVENLSAITYAYPANRKWVFRSNDPNIPAELMKFTGSRMVGWILGWLLNMLLVNVLNVNVFLSTLLVGMICVNVSYFVSKRLVFQKKSGKTRSGRRSNPLPAYKAA